MLTRIRYWLRAIVRRSAVEREMRDEMQLHIDRQTDLLVARGMPRADARITARREFGNVGAHQEDARDARGVRWVDSIGADVRFAFRFFARKPLSSATIVLVLAFGIAGYAAVFGLLQSAILRPPPGVPADVPLVLLRGMVRQKEQPSWSPRRFSYPELREMSALRTIFSTVTGWTGSDVVADMPGTLDHATMRVHFVTDGYFAIVGSPPARGSGLPATVPGAPAESQLVAVISDAMWEDAFGRKNVMNRTLMVNGVGVRIVGVAAPKFNGVLASDDRRLLMWLPLATRPAILAASSGGGAGSSSATAMSSVDSTLFEAVGRLQPGVSPEQATAAVRVVATHATSRMTPQRAVGPNAVKPPVLVYDAEVAWLRGWSVGGSALGLPPGDPATAFFALLGTVATLLLLVVCTNVAALVVSAAVGRRQEIAVRLSLGASRARVIRQLLTESIVLATIGGALGLAAYWGVIVALSRVPDAAFFRPDVGTVAFTLCVALGTGILCGLAPALHATRGGVATALKDTQMGATRRSRLQHTFVVAQVMFTQPLLLLVGILIGTVLIEATKPLPSGISDHVLRLGIDVWPAPGTVEQKRAALDRLLLKLGQTPGVVSVLPEPILIRTVNLAVRAEDRGSVAGAAEAVTSKIKVVTPGYFDLMGVPLVRGSDVVPSSDTSATMIIGSDLARQVFGDADPIGRRFNQVSPPQTVKRDYVVSGVYDSQYFDRGNSALVYRAVTKLQAGSYLIRTAMPSSDLAATIRRIAREELPSAPIAPLVTLAQIETAETRSRRALQAGAAACGALVLLLSSIGLYGAVALGVGERRREIGVRMALGARAGQVVALFYGGGVRLGIIGLVLGLPISLAATYFLQSRGTPTGDVDTSPSLVLVGGIIAGVVLVVASAASLIPATRAARVNPVTALRSE
jgi:predicted permease